MISRRQFLHSLPTVSGLLLTTRFRPMCGVAITAHPQQTRCSATVQEILNMAATVEALTVTFYYEAVTAVDGFFTALPTSYQRYLQLTLDAEQFHYYHLIEERDATPTQEFFHFPIDCFALGQFATFLKTLDELENAAISWYLAAIRQLGELEESTLATLFGQMVGVEAEHRVMGREMAQNGPPAANDLCFERADLVCSTDITGPLASYLDGGPGFNDAILLPDLAQITAAVDGTNCEAGVPITLTTCPESIADILNTAATAEALGITFYYAATQGDFFSQLSATQQWYLQAALDEERSHLDFLLDHGAASPPDSFFFPAAVFEERAQFLMLLDTLENTFISTYLAAIPQLHALGESLLAEIIAQILGVESAHRVLGRVLQGEKLPHNRCLAQAAYQCLGDANVALTPFLTGNATLPMIKVQPTVDEINQAVARFGCTAVPLATVPPKLFLPQIMK